MRFRWNGSYGYRTLYLTVQQIFRYTRDRETVFGVEFDFGFDTASAFKWLKGVFVGAWGDYTLTLRTLCGSQVQGMVRVGNTAVRASTTPGTSR
ncbi:MAG: hypothetical protein HRF45_09605 [Fimbriimonadia bacterium]|jgi:hypothetical protein